MRPESPRIVAILPMRAGSERVRGKNERAFAGKPLYRRVLETLLEVRELHQVVIDTDSASILEETARLYPGVGRLERAAHLRGGEVPMNDVLLADLDRAPADIYLQTHATNPLLRASTVSRALRAFLAADPRPDSLFGVTRLQTRLYDAAGHPINHDAAALLRTQDLPPVYEENSCIYIFTGDGLRRYRHRIGPRALMFEIDREEAWDIDVELDFEIAEFLWNRRHA